MKKNEHRKLIRRHRMNSHFTRDSSLQIGSNSSQLFKNIRKLKQSSGSQIKKLHVSNKLHEGDSVPDGFYDSILNLKSMDYTALESSLSFNSETENYKNILRICEHGTKVPEMTISKAREILKTIRPEVKDVFNISAYHYLYSGEAGLEHFHFMINNIINNINNLSIEELNVVWACILLTPAIEQLVSAPLSVKH